MAKDRNEKKTLIFVLLPEYVDATHGNTSVALSANTNVPMDVDAYKAILAKVKSILAFFGYERIYPIYNVDNLKSFVWPLKTVEDIYPDGKLFLQNQFKNIGWTTADDVSCRQPVQCMLYGSDVSNESIGDIVSRQKFGNAVVVLNIDTLSSKVSPLPVTEKFTGKPIEVVTVDDIKKLYDWLSVNRIPQREYCYNEKHGDKDHSAATGSQLLTNEEETKSLLNAAVGDTKEGSLWLFDKANNAFIYFENQRELRLAFHGYHVHEGDENFENINLEKLKKVGNI